MGRIIAMIVAIALLIWLLCTDLDITQRWIIAGLMWALTAANWGRE